MKLKRQISEKDLLEMFGIPSFRHMTKDKLASFVSALPDVDPEVAKRALEQFPDLSAAMIEIVGRYRGVISECLAGSDADTRLILETCASIVGSVQRDLENEELDFEQRQSLIDRSMELVWMMREIDADEKRLRVRVFYAASITFGIVAGALFSVLGGKVDISLPNLSGVSSRA